MSLKVDVNNMYSPRKFVFDSVPVRFLNTDVTTRCQAANLIFHFSQ